MARAAHEEEGGGGLRSKEAMEARAPTTEARAEAISTCRKTFVFFFFFFVFFFFFFFIFTMRFKALLIYQNAPLSSKIKKKICT
jgi:hypothetical protein